MDFMVTDSLPFRSRIDEATVRELAGRELPAPIDALNLVTFADERSYRWYGLLLAPVLLPRGVRPIWVGVHESSLHGEPRADEIVIVRYPDHRLLLRVVTGRFYGWVNRWREKGVRTFEFSLTQQVSGGPGRGWDGLCLFVHYNLLGSDSIAALDRISAALEAGSMRLVYASREVGSLDILRPMRPSDPNPCLHKHTAVFSMDTLEVSAPFLDTVTTSLDQWVTDLSLQVYRRLSYRAAMPWARHTR